ncbi:MAG: DUF350 domain-containing protein [Candidatus Accumulibacter sp.]|jgi:putative membrane protein|nr:DUF350 domain-containing protein [Accumulibacter sp.]
MTSALPVFLSYFATSMALLFAFLLIYVKITPYNEIALIREGNVAASISLAGALTGFALPIANVIAHSDTLEDLLAWGAVAGMIQLMLYLIVRLAFPRLAEDITHGRHAPAVFLAVSSIVVGILNAACMTY